MFPDSWKVYAIKTDPCECLNGQHVESHINFWMYGKDYHAHRCLSLTRQKAIELANQLVKAANETAENDLNLMKEKIAALEAPTVST